MLFILCWKKRYSWFIHLSSLILSSFFSNFTFFIPFFLDFFVIFSIFFFKGPINSIEVFIGFNPCYSILFINFFSLFFQIQFIILLLFILIIYYWIYLKNYSFIMFLYSYWFLLIINRSIIKDKPKIIKPLKELIEYAFCLYTI